MKRVAVILVAAAILFPISMDAARKTYPMMLGPKIRVGFLDGDGSIYPVSFLGEMHLNLYKNRLWLRTNILELTAYESMNSLGINLGSPFEFVYMGSYKDWRPYGFGGLGIGVNYLITDNGDDISGWAGLTLGGGAAYVVSRYSHIFAEGGLDLGYASNDWDVSLFIGIGARFELSW